MTFLSQPKLNRQRATWVRAAPFFRQLCESALNYFRGGRASLSRDVVKGFFDRHRAEQPDPLVFDGSRSGYYDQLLLVMPQEPAVRYIDLGCGSGSLHGFLRARGVIFGKYIGVDFSPSIDKTGVRSDSTIHNASIDQEDLLEFLVPGTHIVMINSACYQESLLNVPLLQAAAHCQDAALLVVEPYPGFFWDKQFEGIRPRYRHPDQLVREVSKLGWLASHLVTYYLIRIGPVCLWPLAYSFSFKSASKKLTHL